MNEIVWPTIDSKHLIVDSKQMLILEKEMFSDGMPQEALMEKAGIQISRWLLKKKPLLKNGITVFIGPGHNGGDEALVQVTLDCSGRPHLSYDLQLKAPRIGNYDTELVREFFIAFVNNSGITLHINQIRGSNSHHIVEACFKAFSRAMRMATEIDPRRSDSIPSSKGMLEKQ